MDIIEFKILGTTGIRVDELMLGRTRLVRAHQIRFPASFPSGARLGWC